MGCWLSRRKSVGRKMIKIYKTREDAIMPRRATEGSAGYDLYTPNEFSIAAGERKLVKIGISTEFYPWVQGQIWPRSGLAFKAGVDTLAGLIDSDFRGEIGVVLINLGEHELTFKTGEAIAQIVFSPVIHGVVEGEGRISETVRGANGWGSTDEPKTN
jgi:dUTP pyrophosphatase